MKAMANCGKFFFSWKSRPFKTFERKIEFSFLRLEMGSMTTLGLSKFKEAVDDLFKMIEGGRENKQVTDNILKAFFVFLKNTTSVHRACHVYDEAEIERLYAEMKKTADASMAKHYEYNKTRHARECVAWYVIHAHYIYFRTQ